MDVLNDLAKARGVRRKKKTIPTSISSILFWWEGNVLVCSWCRTANARFFAYASLSVFTGRSAPVSSKACAHGSCVYVDVISNCFFSCKDRASERDRPYRRKKRLKLKKIPAQRLVTNFFLAVKWTLPISCLKYVNSYAWKLTPPKNRIIPNTCLCVH